MAVIDQSARVLVLIISHSLALDLFRRSKIDTQEMSLNIFSVFFFAEFSQVSSKVLFSVSNYIFVNTSFWLQSLLSIIKWQQQNKSRSSLSIYYWNLNRISGHNYAKLFLVRAYLAFHIFEIMWLSETYLNSSNSPDNETLEISGYN